MRTLLTTLLLLFAVSAPADAFVRGDLDGAGVVDISDAISILSELFDPFAPPLTCADAADVNDDGIIDIGDAVFLLAALFQPGSDPIPAPWPDNGSDPTADALPPCDPVGLLPFTTIAQGDISDLDMGVQTVFLDAATFNAFWFEHDSFDPPPAVDFTTEMVVAILSVFETAGVTHDIDEIEALSSTVEIRYTTTLPGVFFPMATRPHHFVKCPRTTLPPVFVENVIALP
ncbi:MAG: dockerin type I repeat-containing protein [Planctomycetes bacterium]|nr:dockerin type I repeat-containing protein [Planctomycetota bacterium]